ncbi:hypothetical protein FACS189428_3010 [Clostridia bacterium]|nr:hypothetical protein FACS189428_3010 [Clostridia bacterium]
MNNNKKFQFRAENMRSLFEAEIPHYLIAEIMQISTATISKDVKRVQKQFGITIRPPKRSQQLYAKMLNVYAEGFRVKEKTPLWKCAEKILEVEKLRLGMRGCIALREQFKTPESRSISYLFKPYLDLLKVMYGKEFWGWQHQGFDEMLKFSEDNFWLGIATKGKLPNQSPLNSVEDSIDFFAEWLSGLSREKLTTLSLDEDGIMAVFNRIFEKYLSEQEIRLLRMRFGIHGAEKHSLTRIAIISGIPEKKASYLIGKVIKKLRSFGSDIVPRIKSQRKIADLEQKLQKLETQREERRAFLERRAKEVAPPVSQEIAPSVSTVSMDTTEQVEKVEPEEPIKFLTSRFCNLPDGSNPFKLSARSINCLQGCDFEYIYQLCEPKHWEWIVNKKIRNFGNQSRDEIINFFEAHNCKPEAVDEEILRLCEEYVNS